MTKEEAIKTYEEKKAQIELMQLELRELHHKCYDKEEELKQLFIEHELYSPIEELTALEGLRINEITIYYENAVNEKLSHWCYGDICQIENGRFYYSDYHDGIIEWDELKQCYTWFRHGLGLEIKILGYSDMVPSSYQPRTKPQEILVTAP